MLNLKNDLNSNFFKCILKDIGFEETGLPNTLDGFVLFLNSKGIGLILYKEGEQWNFIGSTKDNVFTENFELYNSYNLALINGIMECCCYLHLNKEKL